MAANVIKGRACMDEPSVVKAEQECTPCVQCGAERDQEAVLKCAAVREPSALCVHCLDKVVALRTATRTSGFHVGL